MGNFTDFSNSTGGAAAIGAGMGLVNNVSNLIFGRAMQKQQLKGYKESLAAQNEAQMDIWNRTNYEAQMEHLKNAGLNPGLLYGMGGGGGATTGGGGAMPQSGQGMGIIDPAGMSQIRLMEAQARKLNVEADNLEQDTKESISKEANNVLQGVILKYAGQEAADQYEFVKKPNRSIEAKTWMDELEARQGIAGTIYELWQEGKLKEKGLAEVEAIAKQNAKTDAERKKIEEDAKLIAAKTKGQNIDNMINELEKEMQTKLGIDRNAPTWIKLLGRLFLGLTQ